MQGNGEGAKGIIAHHHIREQGIRCQSDAQKGFNAWAIWEKYADDFSTGKCQDEDNKLSIPDRNEQHKANGTNHTTLK